MHAPWEEHYCASRNRKHRSKMHCFTSRLISNYLYIIMTTDKYILNTHTYTTNVQVLPKPVTQTVATKQ